MKNIITLKLCIAAIFLGCRGGMMGPTAVVNQALPDNTNESGRARHSVSHKVVLHSPPSTSSSPSLPRGFLLPWQLRRLPPPLLHRQPLLPHRTLLPHLRLSCLHRCVAQHDCRWSRGGCFHSTTMKCQKILNKKKCFVKKKKVLSHVEPVSRLVIKKEGYVAPLIGRVSKRECVSNCS